MIDWIIGSIKVLVSPDFRKSLKGLIEYARKSPEWTKDIIKLEATIKKSDREYGMVFGGVVRFKLNEAKFAQDDVSKFMAAFGELVDNGFAHGCTAASDSITIRVGVFGAGATAEVINNNKSRKIPDLDEFKNSNPSGVTGRGLKTVLSIVNQADITQDGRAIKVVFYRPSAYHHLKEEGITFVNVGGYSTDVSKMIERRLKGVSGDVVIVPGPSGTSVRPPSVVRRVAAEVQKKDFVGRIAIVTDSDSAHFLSDLQASMPKLIGFFQSPEEAVAALRPVPIADGEPTTGSLTDKVRSRRRHPPKEPSNGEASGRPNPP